jgi:peptidoglycan/xylan/chitin deacetylase (PgdA/CDA1 family)
MNKRRLKLGISLFVFGWDIFCHTIIRLIGQRPKGTCVVLYYHGIGAEQRAQFAMQMDALIRLAKPVPAGTKEPLSAGQRHCAVTFDDGFVSVLENALPEMEQRKIPATIFVATGSLGVTPLWIRDPDHPARNERVMTPTQLAALKDLKSVTIGSHSVTHPNFLKLNEQQAEQELRLSKARLEAVLSKPVKLFSFPHGKYNATLTNLAVEAGYERVFTIDPGTALQNSHEFVTGRVATGPDDGPLEFRLKVCGAYRWLCRPHP